MKDKERHLMQVSPVQFGRAANPREIGEIRCLAQKNYGRDQAERLDADYCFVQDRVATPEPEQLQAEAMSDFSRICETLNRKGAPSTSQPVFAIIKFPNADQAKQNVKQAHEYNRIMGATPERLEGSRRIQDWIENILQGFNPANDLMKMVLFIQAMESRRTDADTVQTGPDNAYVMYRLVIPGSTDA